MDIKDKISKILAHAQSAEEIGSEAEAQAFMAQAARLMRKYQIERSQLNMEQDTAPDEVLVRRMSATAWGLKEKSRRCTWQINLASAIQNAMFVRILTPRASNGLTVVGTQTAIDNFVKTFATLIEVADRLSTKAYENYKYYNGIDRTYMRSWNKGFAQGIESKLREQHKQLEATQNTETGLILRNELKRVDSRTDEYLGGRGGTFRSKSQLNHTAYQKGFQKGLNQNVG